MKIVVILPTYNEKDNIERMIHALEDDVLPKITQHDMHILVADDESPDGTGEIVKGFMKRYKNLHLLEGEKNGLGVAYVKAMKYAMHDMKADAVIEFDSDFQHDPHDIPRLIAAMDEGYDYVIGSRYVPGGKIPVEWGIDRKIKSIFGSLFARVVLLTFSIHDMTSGFKLTKTTYLKRVDLDNLYSKYYAYKIQILFEIVKLGARVKEVPIIFYERKKGSSKLDQKDLIDSFLVVLRLRFRESKRFIKFLIVGGSGFLVQVGIQEFSVFLGFLDPIAAGIGAESAILSNFLWNNVWTFQDTQKLKENANIWIKLLKFNTASFASIFIQAAAVWLAERTFGIYITLFSVTVPVRILVLFPTIIFVVLPLNYLIYNRFIWKTQYLKNEKKSHNS